HIGDEALRLIDVQYEVLPAVLDMLEALKSSTPKQFTSTLDGTTIAITAPLVRGDPTNAKADKVVENTSHKSVEQHVALEITNSLSFWDGDKLNVTYTNQHAHGTRSGLAQALKLPQNKVRVFQTGYLGSGYGYRSGIDLAEVHAAILSKVTGRPIMDKASYAIGMDPIKFRLANVNTVGNPDTKRPFSNVGTVEVITGVRDAISWDKTWHAPKTKQVRPGVYHGIGIGVHLCSHGAGSNP